MNAPNFMAMHVGFENSAGAIGHQAVALRVSADKAVFFNCHIDGYQDTLYAQSHRQYYRDCAISGTIDFIFGDAEAIFQNCNMIVRPPLENQRCIVTAGGRTAENSPSALVFQSCRFTADPEYLANPARKPSFLGRPWRAYARVMIMDSHIEDIFAPEGYQEWIGEVFHQTCVMNEYNNAGPGADASKRVQWPGVKVVAEPEAANFYPKKFFEFHEKHEDNNDDWIVASGVPYSPGPMPLPK